MTQIDVVRGAQLRRGDSTRGIVRDMAFDVRGVTVVRSQIARSVSSAWHHHGDRNLYGFLVSGRLRLDYGPKGRLAADLDPGDFFHVPPHLVHRDVNPAGDVQALVVNVLLGEGPAVLNVDGPDD